MRKLLYKLVILLAIAKQEQTSNTGEMLKLRVYSQSSAEKQTCKEISVMGNDAYNFVTGYKTVDNIV